MCNISFNSNCLSVLKILVNKYFPQIEYNLMFKTPRSIKNFFSFKDKKEHDLRSKIVYKIKWRDCDSFCIGKTVRHLKTRLNEHKQCQTGNKQPSVSDNANSLGHEIDWNNVEIIDEAKTDKQLLLKEMLHINILEPKMIKQLNSELFCIIIGQRKCK